MRSNDYSIDGNYIIIPGEGIFDPMWNSGKAAIHQRVYYISTNENICKTKYLYYWYIKNNDILYKNAVVTTVKSLRLRNFLDPEIQLPDLQTQQEIINIIEPFEKLIEQTNKKINNVDLIFQNIIENIKTKSKIVDLASINAGQSPPQISKYWKNGKIPFVNINDLTNNMYVLFSKNFINDLAYNDYRCKLTTNFSILVGKVSPSKNKISVIDNGFIVNGAIRILEPLDKNAYGQLFESIRNKAYILSKIACGSVQQQINSLQLSNLEINFDLSMNEIFNIQLNYKKVLLKSLNVIQKIISSLIELNII